MLFYSLVKVVLVQVAFVHFLMQVWFQKVRADEGVIVMIEAVS